MLEVAKLEPSEVSSTRDTRHKVDGSVGVVDATKLK